MGYAGATLDCAWSLLAYYSLPAHVRPADIRTYIAHYDKSENPSLSSTLR